MDYRCYKCKQIFDDSNSNFGVEDCPYCGSYEFDEVEMCRKCGEFFDEYNINGGICWDCLKKYAKDLDTVLKVGEKEKTNISINGFLGWFFTEEEIEEILLRELKDIEKIKGFDDLGFIDSDPDRFAEQILEMEEENENTKNKP